jgi:hypothetical protein
MLLSELEAIPYLGIRNLNQRISSNILWEATTLTMVDIYKLYFILFTISPHFLLPFSEKRRVFKDAEVLKARFSKRFYSLHACDPVLCLIKRPHGIYGGI